MFSVGGLFVTRNTSMYYIYIYTCLWSLRHRKEKVIMWNLGGVCFGIGKMSLVFFLYLREKTLTKSFYAFIQEGINKFFFGSFVFQKNKQSFRQTSTARRYKLGWWVWFDKELGHDFGKQREVTIAYKIRQYKTLLNWKLQ